MSKITFRADEELIDRVERLDASKSEVMRDALRSYLVDDEAERGVRGRAEDRPRGSGTSEMHEREPTLDDVVAERVDAIIDERLGLGGQDINLTISLEGVQGATVDGAERPTASHEDETEGERIDATAGNRDATCGQCGTELDPDHVHCPNCGEKATHRVFCDCGDELRSDWAFCPSCGRRTPAADVLDGG